MLEDFLHNSILLCRGYNSITLSIPVECCTYNHPGGTMDHIRFQIASVFYIMPIRSPNSVTADSCFESIFWQGFVSCSLTKCHGPPRLTWTVSGVWPTIGALMSIGLFGFLGLKNLTFLICFNELLSDCLGIPEMSSGRYFPSFPFFLVEFPSRLSWTADE